MSSLTTAAQNALSATSAAAPAAAEAPVLSPQKRRIIELLGDAKIFADDDARTMALIGKGLNHWRFANRKSEGLSPELLEKMEKTQEADRETIRKEPYEQLVDSGRLNKMLENYVNFQLERSREKLNRLRNVKSQDATAHLQMIQKEEGKITALQGELKTYTTYGDYTKTLLKRMEPLVKTDKFMPIGRLIVEGNLVADAATKDIAADVVNDVLGTAAARHIGMMARRFDCVDLNAAGCGVVMLAERQLTQPLESLFCFELENTRLDRITALRTLLSAQLNQAFSQENLTDPQKVALVKEAQKLTKEYAQVAMSLAAHFLDEGPAVKDSRVETLRNSFKQEMEQGGITLITDENAAIEKARKLALDSAQDLLVASAGNDAKVTLIKTLAKAAGVPVELPLTAKSQLVGTVVSDPANFKVILAPGYLEKLKASKEQPSADPSLTV